MGIEDSQLDPTQVLSPEEQNNELQTALQDGVQQAEQTEESAYSEKEQPINPAESSNIEPIDSSTSAEQTNEPTHIALIDHNEGESEDKRWDLNKANKLAAGIKHNGSFDEHIERRDNFRYHINLGFTERIKEIDIDDLGGYKIDELIKDRQKKLRDNSENADELIEEELQPFEEIYDLNHEIFAKMPTKEFVSIVKDYSDAKRGLEISDTILESVDEQKSRLAKGLEDKKMTSPEDQTLILYLVDRSPLADDTRNGLKEKLHIYSDGLNFDKSPRQIMEDYIGAMDECRTGYVQQRVEAQQRVQAILDKYKPATSPA